MAQQTSPAASRWDSLKHVLQRGIVETKTFLTMPALSTPTLPEIGLKKLGVDSWVRASIGLGLGFYLLFLLLAAVDGFWSAHLTHSEMWRRHLLFPVIITYLLLIQPIIRRLLLQTLTAFRNILPFNNRLYHLEAEILSLNRGWEWAAVVLGILGGSSIIVQNIRLAFPATYLYYVIGGILVFGLTGWHLYSIFIRTRQLVKIYDQIQKLDTLRQAASYRPLLRWSIGVGNCLLGGVVFSLVFLPTHLLNDPSTLAVYVTVIGSTVLILVFSRVPAALLQQLQVLRVSMLFLLVALAGTVGYSKFEGWEFSEAFYATIITMTTIGYGDYSPSTPLGRVFTIFLSLFAIGIGGYAVTSIASLVIEGNLNRYLRSRKVDKQIVKMRGHYILCGVGRMGTQIATEFYKSQMPFVVIEQDQDVLEALINEVDMPYVQGDATQDEVLKLAGIDRANGLVAALSDDKSNIFITLSARALNPTMRIISRVTVDNNVRKLEKAGADLVISPNEVSGRRMVTEMFDAEVVTFLDEMLRAEQQTGQTLRLEELYVDAIQEPTLLEQLHQGELTIGDIGRRTELLVVAIGRKHGPTDEMQYIYTPHSTTKLQQGDILIVIGTPQQRLQFYQEVLAKDRLKSLLATVLRGN